MSSRSIRTTILLTLLVIVFAVGGVSASWVYSADPPEDATGGANITLSPFEYIEGDEEMVAGEIVVTERFAEELTKMLNTPNQTVLDEIFETRDNDGGWFVSVNELAADDVGEEGAQLRELLGLDQINDLTIIIKFTSGDPGYELFTTRVDIDAVDENGNFIIPESEFYNETTYIYPVNRVTFKKDSATGKYVPAHGSVGYSRCIYYWDEQPDGSWGQSDTRTYDVSTWAEGSSTSTAVTIENDIIGKEITVQNIDKQKEAWFTFTVGGWSGASTGKYNLTTTTAGLTAQIVNSSGRDVTGTSLSRGTYYVKLTYSTEGEPEHFKFTLARG